jgi:hypothetical protein
LAKPDGISNDLLEEIRVRSVYEQCPLGLNAQRLKRLYNAQNAESVPAVRTVQIPFRAGDEVNHTSVTLLPS